MSAAQKSNKNNPQQNKKHQLKVKSILTVTIKRLGINGEGIAHGKGTVIFIPGALPKEQVVTEITALKNNFATGKLLKIVSAAKERVAPLCPVYETCGGCQLQHLDYKAQLLFKVDILRQALKKYQPAGYEKYPLLPTLGMENPWHYRNKAQFQLRKKSDGQVAAGLYRPDSHDLVEIADCPVQHSATTKVLQTVTALLAKYNVPIYNEKNHSGIVKTLMVRIAIATGEIQLVFITQSAKLPQKNSLLREIKDSLPEVVSVMQNIQSQKSSLVMGDETLLLAGKATIEEHLEEVIFDLSPRAFFQLNPAQTKVLYAEARKALDLQPAETLVDAYCGVGTIGLSLGKIAKEVRGMDIIPSAIQDAQKNAARMGLTNTHYAVGTAETLLPKWLQENFRPDAIVVDPPRTGLDAKLLRTLLQQPCQKLVYISCNPATLARDLVELTKVYQVEYLQSVDMFPQTARAEVVVKLSLR